MRVLPVRSIVVTVKITSNIVVPFQFYFSVKSIFVDRQFERGGADNQNISSWQLYKSLNKKSDSENIFMLRGIIRANHSVN
jgi:hypothetical protein